MERGNNLSSADLAAIPETGETNTPAAISLERCPPLEDNKYGPVLDLYPPPAEQFVRRERDLGKVHYHGFATVATGEVIGFFAQPGEGKVCSAICSAGAPKMRGR